MGRSKAEITKVRELAAEQGKPTYEGTPCKKRGHTTRFVSNNGCVGCQAERNKKASPKPKTGTNRQTISNAGGDKEKRQLIQEMLNKAQEERFPYHNPIECAETDKSSC